MRAIDLELLTYVLINAFVGIHGTFGTNIPFFIEPYNWRTCPNGEYGKSRCRPGFKFGCKPGYVCIKQHSLSPIDGLFGGICCRAPSLCPRGQIQGPMCSFKRQRLCPFGYTCNGGVCCLANSVCPFGTLPTSKCTKYYKCPLGSFCLHGTCCTIDKKASICPLKHYPVPGIRCKHHLECPDTSLCYGNTCCQSKFRLKRPPKKAPPIFQKPRKPIIIKKPTIPTFVVVKSPPKVITRKPKILQPVIQRPVLPPNVKVVMCPIGYKMVPDLTCSHITACPGTSECISGVCCAKSVEDICPLDHRIIPEVNCNLRQRCPSGSKCISGVCCHPLRKPQSCPAGLVLVPDQSCNKGTCTGDNICISGSCCRTVTPLPSLITDPPLLFHLPRIPPIRAVRKPVLSTKAPIRLTMPPFPDVKMTAPTPREAPQVDIQTMPVVVVPTNHPSISNNAPSFPTSLGTTASSFIPPTVTQFPDVMDILLQNISITNPSNLVNTNPQGPTVGIPSNLILNPINPIRNPIIPVNPRRPISNVGISTIPTQRPNRVPVVPSVVTTIPPTNFGVAISRRPTQRPNQRPAQPPVSITLPTIIRNPLPSNNAEPLPSIPTQRPNNGPIQPPSITFPTIIRDPVPNNNVRPLPSIPTQVPNQRPVQPPVSITFPTINRNQVPSNPVRPVPSIPTQRPNNVPIQPPVSITFPTIIRNPVPNNPVRPVPSVGITPGLALPPSVTRFPDIIDILLRNNSVTNPPSIFDTNSPVFGNVPIGTPAVTRSPDIFDILLGNNSVTNPPSLVNSNPPPIPNIPVDNVLNPNAVPVLPNVGTIFPPIGVNNIQTNPPVSVINNLPTVSPNIQVNIQDTRVPQASVPVQPVIPEIPIQPSLLQIPSLTDILLNPAINTLIPGSIPSATNIPANTTSGIQNIINVNLPTLPNLFPNIPTDPPLPLDPILPPTDIVVPQVNIPSQQPVMPTFPNLPPDTIPNISNNTPVFPEIPLFNNQNTTIPALSLFTNPPVLPFEPLGNLSTNTVLPPLPTFLPTFLPIIPSSSNPISSISNTTSSPPLNPKAGQPTSRINTIPSTLPTIFPTIAPTSGLFPLNPPTTIPVFSDIPLINDPTVPSTPQNSIFSIPTTLPPIIVPKVSVTQSPAGPNSPPQTPVTIPPLLPGIVNPPVTKPTHTSNITSAPRKLTDPPPIIPNPIPVATIPTVIGTDQSIPRPPPTVDPFDPFPNQPIILPPPPIDTRTPPPTLIDPLNVPIAPSAIPPPPPTTAPQINIPVFPSDTQPKPSPPPLTITNDTVGLSTIPIPFFDTTVPSFNFTMPPLGPLAPIIPPYSPPPAIPAATLAPVIPPAVPSPAGPTFPPFIASLNTSVFTTTTTAPLFNVTDPFLNNNATPGLVQIVNNPANIPTITDPNMNIPPFNFTIPPFDVLNTTLFNTQTTPVANVTYPPYIDPFNFTIPYSNDTMLVLNTTFPPSNTTIKVLNVPPKSNVTNLNVTQPNDVFYFDNSTFPINISNSVNTTFPWINFTFFDLNFTTTTGSLNFTNFDLTTPAVKQNATQKVNRFTPVSSFPNVTTPFNPPFLYTNTTLPPTLWVTLKPRNYSKTPDPFQNSTDQIPFSSTSKYIFNTTYPPTTPSEIEFVGNTTQDVPFVTEPNLAPPTKSVPPFIPTSCPAGNITIPGLSCDKVFKCPAGSSCYYGFCCLPYEMVQVPACLVDFVVTEVCPNPPETDQCRYDRDCGPFMTCCLNSCDRRVCRPTVNPKPSKPR